MGGALEQMATMAHQINCKLEKGNETNRKLDKINRTLEKGNEILEAMYCRLRPSGCQPPRIYSLPIIKKTNVPLTLIASCIGSPSY